jgi:hypothetical protein
MSGKIELTPEMIEAGAKVIESSPWFQGLPSCARTLSQDVLSAALQAGCGELPSCATEPPSAGEQA